MKNVISIIFEEGSNLSAIQSYAFRAINIKKIIFPPKLKVISYSIFDFTSTVEEMYLPASLESVNKDLFVVQPIENLTIEPGIVALTQSKDGSVYHKDGALMYVPSSNDNITIAKKTKSIPTGLIQKSHNLKEILVETNHSTFYVYGKILYQKPHKLYSVPGGIKHAVIDPLCDSFAENAFSYSNVKTVDFNGANVSVLSQELFYRCGLLETIKFSVPITSLEMSCLARCSLKGQKLVFDENLNVFLNTVFTGSQFISIDMSKCEKIKKIYHRVFDECYYLEEALLPPCCESIYIDSFKNCKSLTSIKIPVNLFDINESLFEGCISLKEVIFERGSSVKIIMANAFKNCNISSIVIPNSVTKLQTSCFEGNSFMTDFEFESEESCLLEVSSGAFSGCKEVTTIKFGKNLKSISSGAFNKMLKLKEIIISAQNNNLRSIDGVVYSKDIKTLIICPCGITEMTIHKNVTQLAKGSFLGCELLESIVLPDVLKLDTIPEESFYGCITLKSIKIPQYVRNVSSNAFASCVSLSDAEFANNSRLEEIGSSSFNGCKNLSSISFGEESNIKRIESNAFDGCTKLSKFDFADSLLSIGDKAFTKCPLKTIKFGSKLVSIGVQSFMNCNEIKVISLPSSVERVGIGAFSNCKSLKLMYYCGYHDLSSTIAFSPGMNVIAYAPQEYSSPTLCGAIPLRILDRDCNRPSDAFTIVSRVQMKSQMLSLCMCTEAGKNE